jgi:hypothetical protein
MKSRIPLPSADEALAQAVMHAVRIETGALEGDYGLNVMPMHPWDDAGTVKNHALDFYVSGVADDQHEALLVINKIEGALHDFAPFLNVGTQFQFADRIPARTPEGVRYVKFYVHYRIVERSHG